MPPLWEARYRLAAGAPVYLYFNEHYHENIFTEKFPTKGRIQSLEGDLQGVP